jgi:hypothetical protein
VESTTEETCERGFLRFLGMMTRGVHDLIRQKPSSLLILLGWGSIVFASLMIGSIYLGLVEKMLCYGLTQLFITTALRTTDPTGLIVARK